MRDILTSTSGLRRAGDGGALRREPRRPAGTSSATSGPQRVGYFSQLPFLTLYGFNAEPDSIHRGVTMNLDVLCAKLGPPARPSRPSRR